MPQSSAGRSDLGQPVARPTPPSNSRLSRLQHCHSKWHLEGRRGAELPVFMELHGRIARAAGRLGAASAQTAIPRGANPFAGASTPPGACRLGSVRLDTPLFSGRVEEAKNDANSGASEICRQLRRELVPSYRAAAERPQSVVLRRDRGRFCERTKGPTGRGWRASRSRRAENGARGAQGAVHERALAAASRGKSSEGSLSRGAESGGARHRLCSSKRGEATHHGAEPVSEEKVQ